MIKKTVPLPVGIVMVANLNIAQARLFAIAGSEKKVHWSKNLLNYFDNYLSNQ